MLLRLRLLLPAGSWAAVSLAVRAPWRPAQKGPRGGGRGSGCSREGAGARAAPEGGFGPAVRGRESELLLQPQTADSRGPGPSGGSRGAGPRHTRTARSGQESEGFSSQSGPGPGPPGERRRRLDSREGSAHRLRPCSPALPTPHRPGRRPSAGAAAFAFPLEARGASSAQVR